MSCCGEPKEPNDAVNRSIPPNSTFVNQQPTGQLGLEKPYFQQPNIATPPPIHANSFGQQNTFAQQQPQPTWPSHTPSPPPPVIAPVSPFGSQYGQMAMANDSIMRPPSAHHSGGVPMGGNMSTDMRTVPPNLLKPDSLLDEGKMSISIDFGKRSTIHIRS